MDYYKKSSTQIIDELNSTKIGLTQEESTKRLKKYGLNTITTKSKISAWKIFIDQFKSFIIYILIFAIAISVLIDEYIDAAIIVIILLLNAGIGFFQELNAQNSLEALKNLVKVKAKVYRNKNLIEIDSTQLVKGDIIFLEAGDKVPADCRLIESNKLRVIEGSLTGESLPVEKNIDIIKKDIEIGDMTNMVFSSTSIAQGTAHAIVVKTAMETEIGKITDLVASVEEEATPLQKKLDEFGKKLGLLVIFICIVIFVVAFSREFLINGFSTKGILDISLIAISLAVAAVPEGLPAVVTVALSVGVKRLLKKKALVRNLSSVETLGLCDVICTDKTGTLTQNQMTVRENWTYDGESKFEGVGYNPIGVITGKINNKLLEIGNLCNNASLFKKDNLWQISGDPTEAALIVSSRKAKINISNFKRIDELPFDSKRKLMSVLIENKNGKLETLTKGAPDKILEICSHILINGKEVKLEKNIKKEIIEKNDKLASKAMRVLAFAYKKSKSKNDFSEKNLVFVGLQAMIDPPRPDVIEAIAKTKKAGIRVIMITGDYKNTAKAIGEEIGIIGNCLAGEEIDKLNDFELTKKLNSNYNIFARVIPQHKQRIVKLLQKEKHIVAMTGDGVNDAPALKKADIGIAVGSGTEVAKEASDFVLLDDSFSNIVNAVEEGRGIYDNIQKSIMLLLSGNLGEVLIIFLAVLFGMSLPLTAILLLWINLITDGAPALAFSVDPYGKDIMEKKPKSTIEGILPPRKLAIMGFLGIVATTIALILFNYYSKISLELGQTIVFNFVVLYEICLVFMIRKSYGTKLFSNIWLWVSVIISLILQALIMYTDLSKIFEIVPLSFEQIGVLIGASILFAFIYFIYIKLVKFFFFKGIEFEN